ncbi:RAMP superfamily [Sulfidibacter corallicola]|uniref:CRISPR type III-associated protein domain-containing protein n=1 Tax=Sulfidibacter corallicola TaxID=2818388 RepID=A0A8A4TJV6_SULCO|nr:RAMP superfamily CRISPR-associated protein [Sulfidibacter corallicola]QTD49767.1 hypothetical protein J3U87_29640 [Sulfidibacter corallicola]
MVQLDIELHGFLMIAGGKCADGEANRTTIHRRIQGLDVPYIPGTALRGAIRIQTEALLRGAGLDISPPLIRAADIGGSESFDKMAAADAEPSHPTDLVARLFGNSPVDGDLENSHQGRLRFTDALPVDPKEAAARMRTRAGVTLDAYTGSAETRKLFFNHEVGASREPLLFRATLEHEGLTNDELRILRAAVTSTGAIGGSKGTGGGQVTIHWIDAEESSNRVNHWSDRGYRNDPSTSSRALITCTMLEPACFGKGRPIGNHHATHTFIHGSTLRGAIAWALLDGKRTTAESDEFTQLFLQDPARFGDALPLVDPTQGDLDHEPSIRPATVRELRVSSRSGVNLARDFLVDELARVFVNRELKGRGRWLAPTWDRYRPDSLPARRAHGIVRRARTRVSLNRFSGTAENHQLFTKEQVEPWMENPFGTRESERRVSFRATISGLRPSSARLLAKVTEVPVYIGAGRAHGMGRMAISLVFLGDAPFGDPAGQVRRLTKRVRKRCGQLADKVGLDKAKIANPRMLLALVARSAFVSEGSEQHPLHRWPEARLTTQFVSREVVGGYNQKPKNARTANEGPQKTLFSAIAAGSVYVYEIEPQALETLVTEALPVVRNGIGKATESGCGRFELFEEVSS